MIDFSIILTQFYTYFVLIAIGYIASKVGIISRLNSSFLSAFILNITFPLLIFTTFTHLQINSHMLKNMLFVFFCSYFALFVLLVFGKLSGRILKLEEHKYRIHVMHHMFGNVVFIGFPFLGSLFPGGEGILYASVFHLAGDSILWTYGILFLGNSNTSGCYSGIKHLLNVNSIVFVLSILCLYFGLKVPSAVEKPFYSVGHLTLILALIYVGYVLSNVKLNHLFNEKAVFVMSFNKLVVVPLILLFVLVGIKVIFPFVSNIAITVIVLQAAMPAMATIAILARKYNSDEGLAGKNIFISTILSIVTLPFMILIINKILGLD